MNLVNHYTTLAENKLDRRRIISWHSMDSVYTGLITLVSRDMDVPPPRSPRLRRGGVNLQSLRPLDREPLMAEGLTPTRIALVNARSLTNKSFILNDFFTSRALDFLCVTETWLNASELSVFSEVLPIDCTYFNSPRFSGRGGGVATIFKEKFECRQLSSDINSSFELNIFELGRFQPVLCAVIYRPPKYNKDFINDFSDFLSGIMSNYDRVLIVGDFNIHVCCPMKPLVEDFLNVIDSFNLVQFVTDPTHEHGHTLDLVLSCGLQIL